jgi:hypothetical protein
MKDEYGGYATDLVLSKFYVMPSCWKKMCGLKYTRLTIVTCTEQRLLNQEN